MKSLEGEVCHTEKGAQWDDIPHYSSTPSVSSAQYWNWD